MGPEGIAAHNEWPHSVRTMETLERAWAEDSGSRSTSLLIQMGSPPEARVSESRLEPTMGLEEDGEAAGVGVVVAYFSAGCRESWIASSSTSV